jgi:dolichol-phosphate mannosyltransferase
MDRQVVDAINSIPETERFIRGLRAWVGFSQIGVPYKRPERMFGKSTNNFRRNINWAKKGIFSFSFVPLEIISYLSYVVVLFSFIAISYYTFYYFYMQTAPQGWTTITLLILFLGGIQLLSLSFISEYIGKILDETKKRPKYIIKRTINLKK